MEKYCIIGNDARSDKLRNLYIASGIIVSSDYINSKYIILPTPLSRDGYVITGTNTKVNDVIDNIKDKNGIIVFSGAIDSETKLKFTNNKIQIYDLLEYDDVAILNAIPTVEGAICSAILNSDITLNGSNVLIMGNGRIGKILSNTLRGFGCTIYGEARKDKDLAEIISMGNIPIHLNDLDRYLSKFDYIFNTIPYLILTKEKLDLLKKDVCIIDLASCKGLDYEYAKQLNLNVLQELGLPSKVAPKSAAIYLKKKIDEIIKENRYNN